MLSDIFYFFGLILFFITFSKILVYSKLINIKEWITKFKKVTQKEPSKQDFRSESEYSLFISSAIFAVFQAFWLIFGLLTASWKIFGILLISSFIFKSILDISSYIIQKVLGIIFSTFISASILLLVINHFHLHLDLFKVILQHLH